MMKLFGRWKKTGIEVPSRNNKSILIGNKQGLFDDIVGFDDVKHLFKMAIRAERPVHLLLCGPPASAKSLFMTSLTKLERSIMQSEVVPLNLGFLITCLNIDLGILSWMK